MPRGWCVALLLWQHAATAARLPDSFASGRTAVITGAAAGLGRAMSMKCASLGMRVCVTLTFDPIPLKPTTA